MGKKGCNQGLVTRWVSRDPLCPPRTSATWRIHVDKSYGPIKYRINHAILSHVNFAFLLSLKQSELHLYIFSRNLAGAMMHRDIMSFQTE